MDIIMRRFHLYLILLVFGTFALLLQTGIPETWQLKGRSGSSRNFRTKNMRDYNEMKKYWSANLSDSMLKMKRRRLPYLNDLSDVPPWSYKQFMANMTFLVKNRNQKDFNKLIRSAFNPLKTLPEIKSSDVTRILLVAYFRSGSTFLGDLLQQNWKSFYTFEPLHYMTNAVRIDDSQLSEALDLMNKIFRCNFNQTVYYLEWVRKPKNQFLFKWNRFLWSVCRFRMNTCFEPSFIEQACRRTHVHVVKAARLKMSHVKLLMDKLEDLNVKVVFLVRDPRGTLSSRKKLTWCTDHHNCTDIDSICSEMREDLAHFKLMKRDKPSKFTIVRYEELSIRPETQTKRLFERLNLDFSSIVKRYLRTHTNASTIDISRRNPYTTTRNSKSIAFEWLNTLNASDILHVQNRCGDVLTELGYKMIDAQNLNSFDGNFEDSVILDKLSSIFDN